MLASSSKSSNSIISAKSRGSPVDDFRNSLSGTPMPNEWPVESDVPIIRRSFIDMVQSQTCSKVSPNKSKETIAARVETVKEDNQREEKDQSGIQTRDQFYSETGDMEIVNEILSYSRDKVSQTLYSIQNTWTSDVETVKEDNQRDEKDQKRILHLFAHELVDKVSGLIKRHSASQQLLVPVGKAVSDTTLLEVKTGLETTQQPWESELVNFFTQESVGRLLKYQLFTFFSDQVVLRQHAWQ
ncbi:hypothetical protein DPEC_G00021010 [Dallia pectoralis]|uniref:Uncharacterized protein n=1 Tax=Dallia pectoralis TaxID=75939 RepID=A0ACC2HGE6_DALPE|nr:hypothetical protein DPEC_G00021010 [Dallia pectoralis]